MYINQDSCFPGIVDTDQTCFRYLDKEVIGNEEYLYSNYYREQIAQYGTKITYYVNAYNVLSADNFYGEDPTRMYAPGREISAIVELSENANTLSKFGFEADDTITIYIHLSSFYDTFWDITTEQIATESTSLCSADFYSSVYQSLNTTTAAILSSLPPSIINNFSSQLQDIVNNLSQIDLSTGQNVATEETYGLVTENPTVYESQYNQVQPKSGDVFVLTEYGKGRPGERSGKMFEVTEILDEDISRTNPLGGHYVWIIKGKRFDYSFEPGLSAEKGSQQVYDNAFNGVLSGSNQAASPAKKYPEQYPFISIDGVSNNKIFDMGANDNTDVYGSY